MSSKVNISKEKDCACNPHVYSLKAKSHPFDFSIQAIGDLGGELVNGSLGVWKRNCSLLCL